MNAGIPRLLPSDLSAPADDYVRWIHAYYRVPFSRRQRRLNEELFRRFLEFAQPPHPVLDIGAGRAEKSASFPPGQYVGVDPIDPVSARMVETLPAPLVIARGERLPFADGQFGSVMLWAVLDHVGDRRTLFAEAARVLRAGGRLCLMTQVISKSGGKLGLARWIWSRIRTGDILGMLAVARFTYLDPRARSHLSGLTVEAVREDVARSFTEVSTLLVDSHSLILRAVKPGSTARGGEHLSYRPVGGADRA